MCIITQYAKVLKKRTRILTKKYRLYAAFSVFLLLQLSNFRLHAGPKRGRNAVADKRKAPKTGSNRRQGVKKK